MTGSLPPVLEDELSTVVEPLNESADGGVSPGRGKLVLKRFLREKRGLFGILVLIVLILAAFVGPHLSKFTYTDHDFENFLSPPSKLHWFGTDQTGVDLFVATMHGAQKSILIGLLVAVIATGIAAVVGAAAGYFRGWTDRILMWIVDLLLVVPSFLIIAVASSHFRGNFLLFVVLLGMFIWQITARIVRGQTLALAEREYVLAARFMGVASWKIIFRHILPNLSSLLIIDATINVSTAIILEASLSFFGFGVQPPDVSLGTLLDDGQNAASTYPWLFLFPAGFLVVLVLAVNLVGDALRDALDPDLGQGPVSYDVEEATTSRPVDPDAVLTVSDLNVTFPGSGGGSDVPAVRGVSYSLRRGEVLGIVGESGSGKSVSSLAAMGLLPTNAVITGSVRLGDRELIGLGDRELSAIRGSKISMVFQEPLSALTPVYTIGQQVVEALQIHGDYDDKTALARAVELLELVGIPDAPSRANAFPHEFSGGMRQRVMIAMAIANNPDVIIADEPTTALDVTIQAQILEVLKTAQRETGAAIVMITHDLGVVAGIADRVMVMYAGKPVEIGTTDEIYYHPRMPYTMGLLGSIPRVDQKGGSSLTPIEGNPPSPANLPKGCPFAARCPMVIEICRTTEPALDSTARPGHRAACHRSSEIERDGLGVADLFPAPVIPEAAVDRVPREQRDEVLRLDSLIKYYPLMKGAVLKREVGKVRAVDGIALDIRAGETLGLVGESGCGKSTTLLEILQLSAPQSGEIFIDGKNTRGVKSRERRGMRRDLQVVFQDPLASLDPRLPVSDILTEPMRTHGMSKPDMAQRTRELLGLVGLDPSMSSRYPQEFSGGQRQRVGIARALALTPKLLILDEPVSALDVSIRAGVINLLLKLRAELSLSYLFVAHDLSVVRVIADRVAVMYLGRIVEIGEVESIYTRPSHPYTQALLSAIPVPDPNKERQRVRLLLEGDLPSPSEQLSGCRFRGRCFKYRALPAGDQRRCEDDDPQLTVQGDDHQAACHFAEALSVV